MEPVNQERLRRDVRFLGEMLGEVIRELAGQSALDRIEDIRKISRERRTGSPAAESQLTQLISSLDETNARIVTRAFSIFFDLANLAEDRHRVRVLRLRERNQHPKPRYESIGETILKMRDAGTAPDAMQQALDRLSIELVFTAHPSEAKRRSHRTKIRRMRRTLEELDRDDLLPRERRKLETLLRTELTVLWQSEFLRPSRPTVLQEVRRGLSITPRLWEVVPQIYQDLRKALSDCFPGHDFPIPPVLSFGSWIGGDRDGHPHVTRDVTSRTLHLLREAAIQSHLQRCQDLTEFLSISDHEAPHANALKNWVAASVNRWPAVNSSMQAIPAMEIWRQGLAVIEWRLRQSLTAVIGQPLPTGAYRDGRELESDVEILRESLQGNRAEQFLSVPLIEWLDLIRVFGLHMSSLDVRQDARVYREVMTELLSRLQVTDDFGSLPEEERQSVLSRTIPWSAEIPRQGLSDQAVETLGLFQLLHDAMAAFGPNCLGCHVISLTSVPSDVLTVLWLWRWAQRSGSDSEVDVARLPDQLSIAPLFEKIDDLKQAPHTLDSILRQPLYADHLHHQGSRQVVMIGYSDSTKDGGYLAACWCLYRAQSELKRVADQYNVNLTFFHGRGGSLGRGGGPAARGIFSLPPEALDGSLRLTEQGEVLAERYDDDQIAYRHLEQVTSATLLASSLPARAVESVWVDIMQHMAERSFEVYRELVDQPGFIEFFGAATPIDEIETLNIGSRPARRRGQRTLSDLRAIPWVFSWTQNRCMIPAWYGLGSALASLQNDQSAWQSVCEMYRDWPFFQATIDNAALALAKADSFIAKRYAELVDNSQVREQIGSMIRSEQERSEQAILSLTSHENLLSNSPWLQASIDVRNPYIDPLNLIQIELLRRRREMAAGEAEPVRELLRLTVQGIAAGMRTTG